MVHKFFSGAKKPADIAGFFMPAICDVFGSAIIFEGIKKANAERWPFSISSQLPDVDGQIKCHGSPRLNGGSTWNAGTINVSDEL